MTDVSVLSAELRKAAKTTQQIISDEKAFVISLPFLSNASFRADIKRFREQMWLPAVLAAKEMRNHNENSLREIKELVQRKLKNDNDSRDGFAKKYSLTDTEFFGIVEAVLGKG